MNIIYLHSHDTGRYVQPYGFPVDTPAIQRLAEQGALFRNAHTAAPTCSPSRAALLTGQSAHNAGMVGLAHRGFSLNDPSQHLAHVLKGHGYRTILAGVQHVTTADPATIGYGEVLTGEDKSVASVAPATAERLRQLGRERDAPFFLDVGFFETHRPFPAVDAGDARYVRPPSTLPDTSATRVDMARYLASARELDRGVGVVMDALDEAGLADSTLVICTTDHGIAFPTMKCNLTDHGTGVMLILRGPGGFAGGQVSDALVSQVDLFPTICDLLKIRYPSWLQGYSMVPLVAGGPAEIRAAAFAEVNYHAAYEPQRAIKTSRWTYIRRFGDRTRPVLPNCDEGESRDTLLDYGWDAVELAANQLYDTVLDPAQKQNLFGEPKLAAVREELNRELLEWMRDTEDPLLDGDVPLPVGASINDPASRSPEDELLVATEAGGLARVPNPGRHA